MTKEQRETSIHAGNSKKVLRNYRIPIDLDQAIKAEALTSGKSSTELVIEGMRVFLSKTEPTKSSLFS